ncbi:AcrR family transcriptional regulator [Aeromicrobium panaciterrae]|uniref:AcrR family transcriptional regulator n=1 Tax=Aeromicrobium panaciterrae TaxID=363861 RepID=A0ABU1ULN6_9ACTN|nr:TetR/AcrR family transcriptional regulator [Aeromicrobium panaciterrae]MDR7086081.1 AcrR family transcriptional regulator [Aeromicrobium panaciterrae]
MTEVVARVPVRERLLGSAQAVIEATGWSSVTMAGIADAAGVSRQTVYNEFGTKHGLAQQLALRELERFLEVVRQRMEAESELMPAIQGACEGALLLGEQSLIVRTLVGSLPEEHDPELLQILTTESGDIIEVAVIAVKQTIIDRFAQPFTDAELTVAVEVVVRLVLSAITRPAKPAREAAADIAWVVGLAFKGATS